jgi:MoaA/NifB/PqqE/SkfB family radical SAM enzyme
VKVKYITLLTHGGMLSADRARSLHEAGVNQFSISLDYLDDRHDAARGIPGLSRKIMSTIPEMQRLGISGIRFNTVIKRDNLSQLMPIVRRAEELGCGVNFSCYTDFKNGNGDGLLAPDQLEEADGVIGELLAYKRGRRGVITNSDHYLKRMPRYLRGELTEPCRSGIRTIHLDPSGNVKRCPDFPVDFHWRSFKKYTPIDCNACYYACRGEAEAPLRISRLRDVMA